MPKTWAAVQILGDKMLANRYLRFARQRWLDLTRANPGRSRVLSWRPHPDVLVRVQTNPDKILIKAGGVDPSIYYLHHLGENFTDSSGTYGQPLDVNHEWRTHRTLVSKAIPKKAIQLPTEDYFEPPSNTRHYRPWGSGSWKPGQFIFTLLGADTAPPNDWRRISTLTQIIGYPSTIFQGGWTEDKGDTWLTYFNTAGQALYIQYIGDGETAGVNPQPIGRYALPHLTGTDVFLSTDDPDLFLVLDVTGLRGGWGFNYIGGTTTQLLDNITAGQMTTGDGIWDGTGARSWRYLTYDHARNFTSEIGWPSSYNASRYALFSFCQLSTGNYLAIYPDTGGTVHCWYSTNGVSWNKRAALSGLPASGARTPATTDAIDPCSLSPCENGDALFCVYWASLGMQLWAIYDEGQTVVRRPDPWSTSPGAIDSDRYTLAKYMNVFKNDTGVTTVDDATIVFVARDDDTFDPNASNVLGGLDIATFNNSEDNYFAYHEAGGSTLDWKIGTKIAKSAEEVQEVVTKHLTRNGRPLSKTIQTHNWFISV